MTELLLTLLAVPASFIAFVYMRECSKLICEKEVLNQRLRDSAQKIQTLINSKADLANENAELKQRADDYRNLYKGAVQSNSHNSKVKVSQRGWSRQGIPTSVLILQDDGTTKQIDYPSGHVLSQNHGIDRAEVSMAIKGKRGIPADSPIVKIWHTGKPCISYKAQPRKSK